MRLLYLLLFCLALTGCRPDGQATGAAGSTQDSLASTEPATDTTIAIAPVPDGVADKQWSFHFVSRRGKIMQLQAPNAWVSFKPGKVSAFGGCNTFQANGQLRDDGKAIVRQPTRSSKRCKIEDMGAESRIFRIIENATTWEIDADGYLVIFSDDLGELVLSPPTQ